MSGNIVLRRPSSCIGQPIDSYALHKVYKIHACIDPPTHIYSTDPQISQND